MTRLYPLLGIAAGYLLLISTNPVRMALRDGVRCLIRFSRLWLVFGILALAYAVFQFATFTPLQNFSDLRLEQFRFWATWHWPAFGDVWLDSLLRAVSSVAGIFDAAATTFPLSVIAAAMLILNWRGLHVSLVRAVRKQFGLGGWIIYVVVLISAFASLVKPFIYWHMAAWTERMSAAQILQISAVIDTVAFVFEYLCAVYIQVYLITVALAWIKGLSFHESDLLRFAMRRFSYVLKWLGFVVLASMLLLRAPLLFAYFRNLPNVLDYQAPARLVLAVLIICFCSMQVSLVLHNETLRQALYAHTRVARHNFPRLAWFLVIAGLHYWLLALGDDVIRIAAADRPLALIAWKVIFIIGYALLTGWLLASWVCLFRQCEIGQMRRETWIPY